MTSNKIRILLAESSGFSDRAAAILRQTGELVMADLDRCNLLTAVQDADVLWVRLRHRIDAEVMASAPRLRVIVSPTTGLNHIDLKEAERRGIRVLSLRGETELLQGIRATAEYTLALILALVRRLPFAAAHVLQGGWNRDLFRGQELHEKTAGIVGYGRVGQQVARYLLALGMRVLVTDPIFPLGAAEPGITSVPLLELLRNADVVTLHVSYSAENDRFFGKRLFSCMKKGAWFVNTSRGELVDEGSLLAALQSGWLAGAGLDVLNDEPGMDRTGHSLIAYSRQCGNLIITAHIAGCTVDSMEKTEHFLASKLSEVLLQ